MYPGWRSAIWKWKDVCETVAVYPETAHVPGAVHTASHVLLVDGQALVLKRDTAEITEKANTDGTVSKDHGLREYFIS